MVKAAITVLFIYLYFYYKTKDKKVIKPIISLIALIGAFYAIYFIWPFLHFDFGTDPIPTILAIVFIAIYLPLVMLLLFSAIVVPFSTGSLTDDIKKRKERKSVLLNTSRSNIVFWSFIVLFSILVW